MANPSREFKRRTELILATPALRDYSRTLWIWCENPLAKAIAVELDMAPDDVAAHAAARLVLAIPQFVGDAPDPHGAMHEPAGTRDGDSDAHRRHP